MFGLSRWADFRLRRKGLIVVAAPATATVIIACASFIIGERTAAAELAVRQTLQAESAIQLLASIEADATAALRGFFISGEKTYEDHARERLTALDKTRLQLGQLVSGDYRQAERLALIGDLQHSRLERIFGTTARFKSGVLSPARLISEMKAAEAERERIRRLIFEMENEEDGQLASRSSRVENLRQALKAITVGCLLLGVLGGIVISLMFASGITNRVVALRHNVARLATGEPLNRLPEGRDEIGALCEGLSHAAEILRLRSTALENALQGIAEADAGDRHVSFNKAYAEIASLGDPRTAPGLLDIVHPDDVGRMKDAIGQMRATGKAEVEMRVVSASRQATPVTATLLRCDELSAKYFIFLRDISQRKEAEAALILAKNAAVASREARTRFLAKVSHDIRTPLNAILGAADLLSQTRLTADQSDYVGMFQRNSRRLVALINDFLDFSKIEAGAVRLERVPFRISDLVDEVVSTFRETAVRKVIGLQSEVSPDLPEWIFGDPLRVQQVLVNLLSNGLKFTQAGRVRVVVSKAGEVSKDGEGGQVSFAVADTGPGISPDDQQRIFAEFEQLPNQGDCGHGCGLGLMICRELVEQMKGRISVESDLGLGSTFRFVLPLEAAANPQQRKPERTPGAIRREDSGSALRVLAADDTEDNRLLMSFYLRGEAAELHLVHNGQEALDAFRRGNRFDVVLMDLDMPVLDGFKAAKAIREWQLARGETPTPIVGLSAHVLEDAVRECLDAGCVAHVAKPIDKGKLLDTIRRYGRPTMPPAETTTTAAGVEELVPWYLESLSHRIQEARASLAENQLEPVRRLGHNLKGTGSGYGFPRIAEIGQEIERLAPIGDEQGLAGQLEALYHFVSSHQSASDDQGSGEDPGPALTTLVQARARI